MIHQIIGTITFSAEQLVHIEANSIMWSIQVPDGLSFTVGTREAIFIYLHWNQEQGPQLFGFKKEIERVLFTTLISCSGIGPRIGLAILATMGTENFIQAIYQADIRALSAVNGIGSKKAEQIIVQLKHKIEKISTQCAQDIQQKSSAGADWRMLSEALASLSYSRAEIARAVDFMRKQHMRNESFDQLMRGALAYLAKPL